MKATGPITVVGSACSKTGQEEQVREILRGFVKPSRHEQGCLSYELFEGVYEAGIFYTFETWASEEDLNRHVLLYRPELARLALSLSEEARISVVRPVA